MSDWELDLFSTQLSRKHSFHRSCGKLRYVKMKPKNKKLQPCKHPSFFGSYKNYRCTSCGEFFEYIPNSW